MYCLNIGSRSECRSRATSRSDKNDARTTTNLVENPKISRRVFSDLGERYQSIVFRRVFEITTAKATRTNPGPHHEKSSIESQSPSHAA
jgi:hypothetical protein